MLADQLLQKHGESEGAGKDRAVMGLGVRRCSSRLRSPGDPGYLLICNLLSS